MNTLIVLSISLHFVLLAFVYTKILEDGIIPEFVKLIHWFDLLM